MLGLDATTSSISDVCEGMETEHSRSIAFTSSSSVATISSSSSKIALLRRSANLISHSSEKRFFHSGLALLGSSISELAEQASADCEKSLLKHKLINKTPPSKNTGPRL